MFLQNRTSIPYPKYVPSGLLSLLLALLLSLLRWLRNWRRWLPLLRRLEWFLAPETEPTFEYFPALDEVPTLELVVC